MTSSCYSTQGCRASFPVGLLLSENIELFLDVIRSNGKAQNWVKTRREVSLNNSINRSIQAVKNDH